MKQTQGERVLDYVEQFGSITTREAFIDLGIARLASRIYDLEKLGHHFNRETVKSKNRYGEDTHYTRYTIRKE